MVKTWQFVFASEILGQVHVGSTAIGCVRAPCACVSVRVEVTGEFIPHVGATYPLVVDPVGDTVDCDLHFSDIRVEIVFGVPGACHERVDEQQEDALERPALWVHPKVQPGACLHPSLGPLGMRGRGLVRRPVRCREPAGRRLRGRSESGGPG